MKTPSTLINACLVLGVATIASPGSIPGGLVQARPMHAEIEADYERYLLTKQDIVDELKSWMAKWKAAAQKNGWIPAPKVQNATEEDEEEDHKQRFFMAKQLVERLKKENPQAEFSTDSPFTLLTTDEFHKYITNSYIAGGGARQLREQVAEAPAAQQAQPVVSNTASTAVTSNDIKSALGDYLKRLTGQGNGQVAASSGSTYVVRDFNFGDWFNSFDWSSLLRPTAAPTAAPTTAPTAGPKTTAPAAVPAPVPTTGAPAVVPATSAPGTAAPVPVPTTSVPAPVPTTLKPVPTTTRPAVVPNPNRPVAPIFSPTDTPVTTPAATPKPATGGEVSGDSTGVDWSTGKCMSPIQNQGQCGSCWSFASVAAVETAQCLAQGAAGFTKYSEQTLASCDTRNSGCDGGVPQYAMQYIQKNGLCTLADDPYTSSSGRLSACNTACTKVSTGMKGAQALGQSEKALLAALDQHPVVIAVQAGNDAWKQYKSGVISACPSASAQVDHAVVAVGYDATTIKVRNSWGPRWGEAGYVRLARSSAGLGTCKMFQQMVHAQF